MKRHRRFNPDELMERLLDEFNSIEGLRFLSSVAHLYVEYFLNELICDRFRNPELIIDDRELGGFYSKLTLLRCSGVFDGKEKLVRNIELLNRIRNFYAHNLMIEDDVPQLVAERVNEMEYLMEAGLDGDLDGDIDVPVYDMDTPSRFSITGMSTIIVLSSMFTDD